MLASHHVTARGGYKGGNGGHVPPPKPQVICLQTGLILHCRVLFYKFTDIAAMFLSRDSLY